jgi:hypothetical protein
MLMRLMRYRPSPAIVVATLALVLAGAGIGTAASGLISGSKIKPGTITGKQIKNHSITLNKLSGKLPAGPKGPRGLQGLAGPPGPFPATLPAGDTVRGVFGIAGTAAAANALVSSEASWFWPLATAPTVTIRPVGATPTATCPGTASNPEAAAGNACIYESDILNTVGVANNPPATVGVVLYVRSTAAGEFFSEGTWAVTG